MKGEQISYLRAASHGRAPALTKLHLILVFLGVYTVGFFGKTFLKTWHLGLQMGGGDLAAPSKLQKGRGFSLDSDLSGPGPGAAFPPWDPWLAKEQDTAAKPAGCPLCACLNLGGGQVQRPLGAWREGADQTTTATYLLPPGWTTLGLSQKSLQLFFFPKLELPCFALSF